MRTLFFILLSVASVSAVASESIECLFTEYHLANHINHEMSGYSAINQSLSITNLKTSDTTLKLQGDKRATNSITWLKQGKDSFESTVTSYIGNLGEILTLSHTFGENKKGLNGWYKASLVTSNVNTTSSSLGKCLVKSA